MAVGVQSFFSIREFVAKVRDVDVDRCWPFGGRDEGEERVLPDMAWRKHRWWASELRDVRSARRDLGRGGFSGAEKGEGGDRSAEEEADEGVTCLGNVTRAPKKRSIAELFAVAPQIEGGGEGQLEEEERAVEARAKKSREEQHVEVHMPKKKKRKKKNNNDKNTAVDKRTRTTKKRARKNWGKNGSKKVTSIRKKQKQITRTPSDKSKSTAAGSKAGKLRLKNKDKAHKINLASSIDISQTVLDSVVKSCGSEGAIQHVKRKPAGTRILPTKKKQKITETTKSSLNKEYGKSTFSILGILKKQRRLTPSDRNSPVNLQNGDFEKHQHVRHQKRRVSFSCEDDILGPKNKSFPLKTTPVHNLCKVFSNALTISEIPENFSKGDKEPHATDERKDVADDTHTSTITHDNKTLQILSHPTEVHETTCPRSIDTVGPSDHPTSQEIEKNTSVHSVDLNHSLHIHNELNLLEPCTSLAPSRHTYSEGSVQLAKLGVNSASYQGMEGGYSSKHIFDNVSRTSTINSMSSITDSNSKQSLLPLTAKSVMDKNSIPCLDARNHAFNLAPHLHQFDHGSKNSVVNCQLSAADFDRSYQNNLECGGSSVQNDQPAIFHKYNNGNFFGLPLNSHGELINLDSHGILQTLSGSQSSIGGFSMPTHVEPMQRLDHHKKKGNFTNFDLSGKEKCLLPWKSLFKSQPSTRHRGVANIYPEYHDLGQKHDCHPYAQYLEQKQSCPLCKEHDAQKTATFNEFSDHDSRPGKQPTMRLMGKIVTVGKTCKECQCLEDGIICADKETIYNPFVRIPDKSLENWQSQHELFAHSASESSKRSFVHPLDTIFCNDDFDFHQKDGKDYWSQHCHIDGLPHWLQRNRPINGSHLSRAGTFIQPQTSALSNDVPKKPVTCISGTKSTNMLYQVPSASSVPFEACQHMLLNPIASRLSQNPSSDLHQSFLNVDYGNHIPAQNLQQWLIDAANYRTNPNASLYTRPASDYHHLCTISKVNQNPASCPFTPPVSSFHDQIASHTCLPNLSMTSRAVSSLVTDFPSMGTSFQGSLKNRRASKSQFMYIEEHNQDTNTGKMPPSKTMDMMKTTKKSNLVILDDSNDLTVSRKTDPLHGCIHNTSVAPGFCSHIDKTTNLNNNEKNVCSNSSRLDSPKLDGGLRSGPIKLSAGAKHILKPNQNMDVDKCRPVYSTVPFAVGSDAGKVPLPQKKSAKIYQF